MSTMVFFTLSILSLLWVSRVPTFALSYSSTCSSEETGDIRLYNTVTDVAEDGLVQICKADGLWYTVCGSSWDCNDGAVACRELGYDQARSTYHSSSSSLFGYWTRLDSTRYNCHGDEEGLKNCSTYYNHYSSCYYRASVRCIGAADSCCSSEGSLRLVGGGTDKEGVLEYCTGERWSPFCNHVDDEEASVACKQMGFSKYSRFVDADDYSWNNVTMYTGTLFDYYFSCSSYGHENSLSHCHHYSLNHYSSTCTSSCIKPIAIRCFEPSECTNGDYRLVNGYIPQQGRVEVCVNGVWGSMCGSGWNKNSAFVVCKYLGFLNSAPVIYSNSEFGRGDGPIVYSYVTCHGWETSFEQCSKQEYLHFSCSHTAGVLCTDGCSEGEVRLVNGATDYQGVVEVCLNSVWGLISDSGWDYQDAKVVCRQLNMPTNDVTALQGSFFGKPDRSIHYSYVLCQGSESSLSSCNKVSHSLSEGRLIYNAASVASVSCHHMDSTTRNFSQQSLSLTSTSSSIKITSSRKATSDSCSTANTMMPTFTQASKTPYHQTSQSSTIVSQHESSVSIPSSTRSSATVRISSSSELPQLTTSITPSTANLTRDTSSSLNLLLMIVVILLVCLILVAIVCFGIFVIFKTVKCYREPREALPSIVYSNLVNEAPNDGNELNSEQAQEKEKLVFEEEY